MSKLQELISRLCPDGVQYKPIREIATCYAGATPKTSIKEYWENGSIPWMSSGEVNKQVILETDNFITQAGFDSCSTKMVPANSVVMALAGQGKTRGLVALTKIELCTNQSLCAIVPNSQMNSSFLYHFLTSQYQQLRTVSSGDGTRGGLNLQMVNSYIVPVPPIEVQEEIVRILDTFSAHAAELQAELQARKEQYEYYRNQLLSFNGVTMPPPASYKIDWKAMGEIGKIKMCKRIMKHQTSQQGDVPFYKIGTFGKKADAFISRELFEDYKSKFPFPKKGTILVSAAGTIGRSVIYDGEDAYFQDSNIVWLENDESKVLNKYLYHYYQIVNWNTDGGTIKRLYNDKFLATIIPIPPLELQEKIVAILDRFETLVNDLTQGLPAEIAAVKEQYEYYRNKLLTFKQIA